MKQQEGGGRVNSEVESRRNSEGQMALATRKAAPGPRDNTQVQLMRSHYGREVPAGVPIELMAKADPSV